MDRNDIAWRASRIALAGAVLPIAYGVLACAFRYPHITGRPFEALWAVANAGMIANLIAWLSLKVARPRLALIGGGLAIVGHLVRIAVSVVIEVRPDAAVDTPIAGSVVLMFAGLALLGVATLRAGRLSGWPSLAPLLVLLGGLIAAPFYTIDKVVHFILLGLLWGTTWLFMAYVSYRQLARHTAAEAAAPLASMTPFPMR